MSDPPVSASCNPSNWGEIKENWTESFPHILSQNPLYVWRPFGLDSWWETRVPTFKPIYEKQLFSFPEDPQKREHCLYKEAFLASCCPGPEFSPHSASHCGITSHSLPISLDLNFSPFNLGITCLWEDHIRYWMSNAYLSTWYGISTPWMVAAFTI